MSLEKASWQNETFYVVDYNNAQQLRGADTLSGGAEHPVVLLLVAVAIIIALAIKKPRHWIWWVLATILTAAILAIFENEANRRRDR